MRAISGAALAVLFCVACAETEEPSGSESESGGTTGAGGNASIDGSTWQTGGAAGDASVPDGVSPATGASCAEILSQDPGAANGVYQVTGVGLASPVEVYCDMTGGGFTLAFVSSQTASDKGLLAAWYADTGVGALTTDGAFYSIPSYGTGFHHAGIELRLTWECGTNLSAPNLVGGTTLGGGSATWKDNRTLDELLSSNGSYHQNFSDFTWTGDACFSGEVSSIYVYGFSIGNGGGYGQYLGWFDQDGPGSSAVSDNSFDNVVGTVAGWFR
jgi:hypothetical protein